MADNIKIGRLQDVISKEIIKFEKEYLGRGPEHCKTVIIDDLIIVRLDGVLTKAEQHLCKTAADAALVKQIRIKLIENAREIIVDIIEKNTGIKVKSLHTDLSTKTGERIIVFILENKIV